MGIKINTSPSRNKVDSAVTPSPQAQAQALQDWSTKHKNILDIFLDAYCVVDLNNTVVNFNVAFTELVGDSYRKILKIGSFCELLKTELCPHQCPARQVIDSKKAIRLDELKGQSKAFNELNMILGGVPILNEQGEILGSLITIRNVSAESELQKKYHQRKEESAMDGLTRLYNKTFTTDGLFRMIKTGLREKQALSVLMCDIDHFKKVNDTYGHQAGDYVLSLVAQMLKGESRDSDIVGRFGGEEFMVILANSEVAGAKIFAERFRNRVTSTKIIFEGRHIPVSVSLGTATFKEAWSAGMNPENLMKELIHKADTALYFSKANGRNQTRQYETLPAENVPKAAEMK